MLLENYRQVDTGGVRYSLFSYDGLNLTDTRQIFSNGVAKLPEAYRLRDPVWYNGIFMHLPGRTFCFVDSGYSIEYRMKMLTTSYDNSKNVFYITSGSSIGAIFVDNYNTGPVDGLNL